jgi:hypothetical protein
MTLVFNVTTRAAWAGAATVHSLLSALASALFSVLRPGAVLGELHHR